MGERRIHAMLTPKEVYNLTLLTTDDVNKAERAEAEFILQELRAGRTPEVE